MQAFTVLLTDNQPINYNINIVYFVPVYLHFGFHIGYSAIYPNFQITLFAYLFKKFTVMTLTSFYYRRQDINRLPVKFFKNGFQYLILRHALHLLTCNVRVCFARTCEKQAHKIIYLGNGPY